MQVSAPARSRDGRSTRRNAASGPKQCSRPPQGLASRLGLKAWPQGSASRLGSAAREVQVPGRQPLTRKQGRPAERPAPFLQVTPPRAAASMACGRGCLGVDAPVGLLGHPNPLGAFQDHFEHARRGRIDHGAVQVRGPAFGGMHGFHHLFGSRNFTFTR